MPIELSVITSLQAFKECKPKWERFRQKQNDNAMCNSWHWMNTWLAVFERPQDKLYIHIWSFNEEVVGIIPCYIKKTFAGNELRFIATGEPTCSEVCSEFQDFMLDDKFSDKILEQFSKKIVNDKYISAIFFDNILTTSNAYKWLESINIKNWKKTVKHLGNRYLIPVKQIQKEQVFSFKSKNIKRHAKKILADTRWNVTVITEVSELKNFYQKLIKEHNAGWNKRGKVGAFEQSDFVKFHQVFSQEALKKNKLLAFNLECEKEFCALFYGIIDGDILYYYQSAVNHDSKLSSAGVAMHIAALTVAHENNLAFYDLMKGDVNSYKAQYIESNIEVVNSSIFTLKYKCLNNSLKVFRKLTTKIAKK